MPPILLLLPAAVQRTASKHMSSYAHFARDALQLSHQTPWSKPSARVTALNVGSTEYFYCYVEVLNFKLTNSAYCAPFCGTHRTCLGQLPADFQWCDTPRVPHQRGLHSTSTEHPQMPL